MKLLLVYLFVCLFTGVLTHRTRPAWAMWVPVLGALCLSIGYYYFP